jgi:hypothetical protein
MGSIFIFPNFNIDDKEKIVKVTNIVLKEDCVKSYHVGSHRKSIVRIHEWAFNKYRFRVINILTMSLPSIIEKDIYMKIKTYSNCSINKSKQFAILKI